MSRPQTIIWIDPGQKTGIAEYNLTTGLITTVIETPDFQRVGDFLSNLHYLAPRPVAIGWENFIISAATAKKTQAPWSLEVIGVCRWLALSYGWTILQPQAPADRHLGKKEWVDALGWCPRGARDDGMSACQHLLAYLLRSGLASQRIRDMIVTLQQGSSPG